jgi:dTDP-4-amino-4,6-dideoxygalactose transaminase
VIRTAQREQLREHLRAAQIGTGIHYPVPVHLQPAYRNRLGEFPAGLPETTRAMREILSLPIYPQLAEEAADRVIAETRRFFE